MSLVDLGKRLLDAAKLGQTDEVRTLMSNGAPFTTDWLGTSPLHYAVAFGHSDTAEVLLRAGISRDARTKVDRTPLHIAAQEGHVDIVDMLIRNGADIEAKDMLRMTPLHWAVEKCHTHVIEVLIDHAADISCENKFDRSPVDIALESGRNDIADMLQLSRETTVEIAADQTVIEEVTTTEETDVITDVITDGVPDVGHHPALMTLSQAKAKYSHAGVVTKLEPDTEVTEDASQEQNNTAVLATLAALAEATAPLGVSSPTGTSAAETLNWLESQRITMISEADRGSIVTSSLSSGQSFTLTEAGKLALNIVSDGTTPELAQMEEVVTEEGVEEGLMGGEEEEDGVVEEEGTHDITTQKVITIVSAASDIPEDSETETATELHSEDDGGDGPTSKRLCVDETSDTSAESLRLQLEQAQREAARFKRQLLCKQREADIYKEQLTKIAAKPAAVE